MKNKYQMVVITLSDGSVIYFTGKAQVPEDTLLSIDSIRFTVPKDLPEGMSFGIMEEFDEETNDGV